jgi:hypothetical protein
MCTEHRNGEICGYDRRTAPSGQVAAPPNAGVLLPLHPPSEQNLPNLGKYTPSRLTPRRNGAILREQRMTRRPQPPDGATGDGHEKAI